MNKKMIFFMALLLFFTIGNVYAEEGKLSVEFRDDEKADIVGYEADLLRQMKVLAEEKRDNELPNQINFDNSVKVYSLSKLNSVEDIKNAVDSGSYFYKVPLLADKGYIYSTLRVSDNRIVGYDTSMTYDKSINQATYLFEPQFVENIVKKNNLDFKNPIVFTIPSIKTDFIFVYDDNPLVIPFASRPDFLKLENGKIYEFKEFAEAVNILLEDISVDENVLNGKSGGSGVGKSENNYFYIFSVSIIGTVCLLGIFVKIKNKFC